MEMHKSNGASGRPPHELAQILSRLLGESGRSCLTVRLDTVRTLASRSRLDAALIAELTRELARSGIVFGQGRQVAVLAEDVDFSPATKDCQLGEVAGPGDRLGQPI
jgi:hypothetical protein